MFTRGCDPWTGTLHHYEDCEAIITNKTKMKRYCSYALLLISLLFILFCVIHSQGHFHYSRLISTEEEIRQIKSIRTETDKELLDEITFDNFPLLFDELTSRWFCSISPDTDHADPAVDYSPRGSKVHIAFSGELKPGDYVPFTAYTDTEYRNYTLAVTTLPLIHIRSTETDYLTGIDINEIHPVTFSLYDNRPDSLYPVVNSDAAIHIRGNGSRYYDKKSFRLSLTRREAGKEIKENQIPLLGLRQDGDWILYAAYNDQEKIREIFSSNLWLRSCGDDNSFGLKNGMEYRYAELFWNREYCGLYALGYPIDAKQMGVQPDVTGHYDEFVFKQKHWGPKTEGPNPDYDGLILQHEANQSDTNNAIGFSKMYFSMLEAGAPNGLWNNDEANALDIWLFVKLIQAADTVNSEGKMRNMFLTIKKSGTGTKILYTPWDMDISWGNRINSYNSVTYPYDLDVNDNSIEMTINPVSVLLDKDPSIVKKVKEQYAKLRAGGWSDEAINSMLDVFEQKIYDSGAYQRDMERWPDGKYQDPELKLSLFREYVLGRLQSMDTWIEDLPLP